MDSFYSQNELFFVYIKGISMRYLLLASLAAIKAALGGRISEVPVSKIGDPIEHKFVRKSCNMVGSIESCDIGDNQLLLVYNKVL